MVKHPQKKLQKSQQKKDHFWQSQNQGNVMMASLVDAKNVELEKEQTLLPLVANQLSQELRTKEDYLLLRKVR